MMCRIGMALMCAMCVAACANVSRDAAFHREEATLFEARQRASVRCDTDAACDAAWARTRAFIETHSVSRVTRADQAIIESAMPHSFGYVFLSASKVAADEGGAVIRLKAMCRGMYDTDGEAGLLYSTCADAIFRIEAAYQDWMAADR